VSGVALRRPPAGRDRTTIALFAANRTSSASQPTAFPLRATTRRPLPVVDHSSLSATADGLSV